MQTNTEMALDSLKTLMKQKDWNIALNDFALCRLSTIDTLNQLTDDQSLALLQERNPQGKMLWQEVLSLASQKSASASVVQFCYMVLNLIAHMPLGHQTLLFDAINHDNQILMNALTLPEPLREQWSAVITQQAPEVLGAWLTCDQSAVLKNALKNSSLPRNLLWCLHGLATKDFEQIIDACDYSGGLGSFTNVLFNIMKWIRENRNLMGEKGITWYQNFMRQVYGLCEDQKILYRVQLFDAWRKTLGFAQQQLQQMRQEVLMQEVLSKKHYQALSNGKRDVIAKNLNTLLTLENYLAALHMRIRQKPYPVGQIVNVIQDLQVATSSASSTAEQDPQVIIARSIQVDKTAVPDRAMNWCLSELLKEQQTSRDQADIMMMIINSRQGETMLEMALQSPPLFLALLQKVADFSGALQQEVLLSTNSKTNKGFLTIYLERCQNNLSLQMGKSELVKMMDNWPSEVQAQAPVNVAQLQSTLVDVPKSHQQLLDAMKNGLSQLEKKMNQTVGDPNFYRVLFKQLTPLYDAMKQAIAPTASVVLHEAWRRYVQDAVLKLHLLPIAVFCKEHLSGGIFKNDPTQWFEKDPTQWPDLVSLSAELRLTNDAYSRAQQSGQYNVYRAREPNYRVLSLQLISGLPIEYQKYLLTYERLDRLDSACMAQVVNIISQWPDQGVSFYQALNLSGVHKDGLIGWVQGLSSTDQAIIVNHLVNLHDVFLRSLKIRVEEGYYVPQSAYDRRRKHSIYYGDNKMVEYSDDYLKKSATPTYQSSINLNFLNLPPEEEATVAISLPELPTYTAGQGQKIPVQPKAGLQADEDITKVWELLTQLVINVNAGHPLANATLHRLARVPHLQWHLNKASLVNLLKEKIGNSNALLWLLSDKKITADCMALLDELKQLDASLLIELLILTDSKNNNGLMMALRNGQPLPLITRLIEIFTSSEDLDERRTILTKVFTAQTKDNDLNVFGLAVDYQQEALPLLIKTTRAQLPLEKQVEIIFEPWVRKGYPSLPLADQQLNFELIHLAGMIDRFEKGMIPLGGTTQQNKGVIAQAKLFYRVSDELATNQANSVLWRRCIRQAQQDFSNQPVLLQRVNALEALVTPHPNQEANQEEWIANERAYLAQQLTQLSQHMTSSQASAPPMTNNPTSTTNIADDQVAIATAVHADAQGDAWVATTVVAEAVPSTSSEPVKSLQAEPVVASILPAGSTLAATGTMRVSPVSIASSSSSSHQRGVSPDPIVQAFAESSTLQALIQHLATQDFATQAHGIQVILATSASSALYRRVFNEMLADPSNGRRVLLMRLVERIQAYQTTEFDIDAFQACSWLYTYLMHLEQLSASGLDTQQREAYSNLWDLAIHHVRTIAMQTHSPQLTDLLEQLAACLVAERVVQSPAPIATALPVSEESKRLFYAINAQKPTLKSITVVLQEVPASSLIYSFLYRDEKIGHNVLSLALEKQPQFLPQLIQALHESRQLTSARMLQLLQPIIDKNMSLFNIDPAIYSKFTPQAKQVWLLLELSRRISVLEANMPNEPDLNTLKTLKEQLTAAVDQHELWLAAVTRARDKMTTLSRSWSNKPGNWRTSGTAFFLHPVAHAGKENIDPLLDALTDAAPSGAAEASQLKKFSK